MPGSVASGTHCINYVENLIKYGLTFFSIPVLCVAFSVTVAVAVCAVTSCKVKM